MYIFCLDYTFQPLRGVADTRAVHLYPKSILACMMSLKVLSLGDRVKVIQLSEKGISARQIAGKWQADVVDAGQHGIDTSDTEDDDDYDPPQIRVQTYKQAVELVHDLFQFLLIKIDQKMLDLVAKLESVVQKMSLEARQQQTLSSFFFLSQ